MFGFFASRRRARTIATSIGQLIHMFSTGFETWGPGAPEMHLRGLGTGIEEEMMGDARLIRALVPMSLDEAMWVSLFIKSDGQQTLMINGQNDYAGFSISCGLPAARAILIDLQPAASRPVTRKARLLYTECRTMPNAVDASDFR
jgi:hypothetical protein